jgi:hypothetical protein
MYAGGGDKPSALREAKRAVELERDDIYYAPATEEGLAIVEAQTGEKPVPWPDYQDFSTPITSAGSPSLH